MNLNNNIPTNQTNVDGPTNAIFFKNLICIWESTVEYLADTLNDIKESEQHKRQKKKKYGSGGKLLKRHDFFNK